jgi:hypothetical protein
LELACIWEEIKWKQLGKMTLWTMNTHNLFDINTVAFIKS